MVHNPPRGLEPETRSGRRRRLRARTAGGRRRDRAEPERIAAQRALRPRGRTLALGRDGPRPSHRAGRLRAERRHPVAAGVEREALRLLHRPGRARAGLPLPHRGARRGAAGRACLARTARAEGLRRSDAHREGHRPPRRPDRRARDPADHRHIVGDDSWLDRRWTVAGWKPEFAISESPPLSALVVDRGWHQGRPVREPALAAAAMFDRMLRARGIVARDAQTGRAKPGAVRLAKADSGRLSAHPQGGRHRQRQLLGRARPEGDRARGAREGDVGRRRRRRPSRPPGGGCAGRRRARRRRLGPLAARPRHGARALDAAARDLEEPEGEADRTRLARRRGHERHARAPPAVPARVRARPREDRHDERRVGALRLRRLALRVRRRAERLAGRHLVGTRGAGPLRPGARRTDR